MSIDTIGNYCQCNLIDSSHKVKNPEGIRPEQCETCEYKMCNDCFPCGSEFRTTCIFTKERIRVLQEFEQLKSPIEIKINESNKHACNKSECQNEAIFCVKNYHL